MTCGVQKMGWSVAGQGEAEAVRQQVERILASKIFLKAQRSQAFLRYAVERSIAGAAPKEYEIAVDVLGRSGSYDPAVDATVRVEAGRLRGRLREYYATEGKADPLFIEIPKGGYAVTFKSRELDLASPPEDHFPQIAEKVQGRDRAAQESSIASLVAGHILPRPLWIWLTVGLSVVTVCGIWLTIVRRHAPGPIRSLAVLPLQNLSGDPNQQYFADGMTDELITELAHIPNLRVVSRTSVMEDRGNGKPLRQIARELEVDAVVEGSVVRSGNGIRITAQLIDARDDKHIWAQSFEEHTSDTLELQDRVAREIALQAKAALSPEKPNLLQVRVKPDAYDAYLRGLFFLHQREPRKSAEYFQKAISIDSSFAAAYAGFAQALDSEQLAGEARSTGVHSTALAAAKRAVELDPSSGEARTAVAMIEIDYEKDWVAARQNLETAVALSPNYSLAEIYYAIYLDAVGRPEEAVSHMRRALQLDPLSFFANRHMGSVLYFARQYTESLSYLRRAIEMQPSKYSLAVNWESRDYEMSGNLTEAEKSDLLLIGAAFPNADLAPLRLAYQQGGWKAYQSARIEVFKRQAREGCDFYEVGEGYIRLGDGDHAYPWFERAIQQGCFWSDSLKVDPLLDNFRNDPRYQELLRRVHLAD
jgi:TolB-like protein